MIRRMFAAIVLGVGSLCVLPSVGHAALTSQDAVEAGGAVIASPYRTGPDFVEAQQFRLKDARVAGRDSARQSVTAWQVTQGKWNGENLDGLSMVLVQTTPEDGRTPRTTNCYVSYLATPEQRDALLSAYFATQEPKVADARVVRIEPAVIKIELAGRSVIVHLGLVA